MGGVMITKRMLKKLATYEILYGTSFIFTSTRKWFNPMRWVFGIEKHRMVDPKKLYKRGAD